MSYIFIMFLLFLYIAVQDSVGENRTWDLVFVDNDPMNKRTATAARLLKRTKVLIIHDTEDFIFENPLKLPIDFM